MLTRRLLLRSSPSTAVRALSTTSSYQRAPSLADIEPNGAPTFDARQKKFREGIKEAQKAKEQQDSQFVNASSSSSSSASSSTGGAGGGGASTAQNASNASSSSASSSSSFMQEAGNGHVLSALGSLATHTPESAREADQQQETSKRKGALSSLIYGTREGQQMDQEIEKSFSQVLARGKYVHSIVFHTVKPDKVDEYVEVVGSWYPKMAKIEKNHVNLVGSWRTEVGDCDTFGQFCLSVFRHCDSNTRNHSSKHANSGDTVMKSTSGSTNATKAITPPSTPSPPTPTSPPSTTNSNP
ncbi:MAG: hypothetical protein Q9188_006686 [Gyalolechia gomerana]